MGDRLTPDELAAWTAAEPPHGFADRVLAARAAQAQPGAPEPRSRWPRGRVTTISAAVVAAACVGALLVGLGRGSGAAPASGEVSADERASVAIGRRGVAVAEPGAELTWRVSAAGDATVMQFAGDVFYRVDRGGSFRVRTQHGDVSVQGTCFRVVIGADMKLSRQAFVGAAVGAALVVVVYEGKVLLANDQGAHAASAGEAMMVRAGEAPETVQGGPELVAAAPGVATAAPGELALDPPPPESASRDELLARDEAQRRELATLRANIGIMTRDLAVARRSAQGGADTPDGRPWFDPSQETLQRYAKECRVDFDVPPVLEASPRLLSPERGQRLGLTAEELAAINGIITEMHGSWNESVRALYLDATGDATGADTLSPMAMARELEDKSLPGEGERLRKRIAWERAGMLQAPADWSNAPHIERYYRMLAALGDEMESRIGQKLGPERARALREKGPGWGNRISMSGCPSEDEGSAGK